MGASRQVFRIVQIGFGVLGKAYHEAYTARGNSVSVLESNKDVVQQFKGNVDIHHTSDNLDSISEDVDFIMIMVCTPALADSQRLDMSFLHRTLPNVAQLLRTSPDALVLIRSTISPLETRRYRELLQELLPYVKINIGFQPEFLRQRSAVADALRPWQVVLGSDELDARCRETFRALHLQYTSNDNIVEMALEEAELLKLFHNGFNACKISYFNNCMLLCQRVAESSGCQVDMHTISRAMVKTCEGLFNPSYGTQAGRAYDGGCLPKDSVELGCLEQEYGLSTRMFSSITHVNAVMQKDKWQDEIEIEVA